MIQDNQSNSGGFAAVLDALRQKYGWKLNVQIGEGGFAYVFKENVGGLPRAVKISKSPVSTNTGGTGSEQRARLSELRVVRDLGGHPRLLTLIQYGLLLGHLVTVWELAEGSLAHEAQKRKSEGHPEWPKDDLRQLLEWMKEAAEGIDYLNQNGVYHRDIKPQNLFLVRGHVKLGDFGLVKEGTASILSNTGVGTLGYMPPEAMAGHTHRTIDIYGLAATYVRLRTGQEPFGSKLLEIHERVKSGTFERAGMTQAEAKCVAWALHPDPEKRFAGGAVAWVRKLDQLHHASPSKPSRPGQQGNNGKNEPGGGSTIRRNWQALLVIGVLCGLMVVWWLIRNSDPNRTSPPMQTDGANQSSRAIESSSTIESSSAMQTSNPVRSSVPMEASDATQIPDAFPSSGVVYIKRLPAEIVQAWENAGATAGWMGPDEYGFVQFIQDANLATRLTGAVPAFRFSEWKDGQLAGLPGPAVPFGVDLSWKGVTDAGLAELKELKNLTVLYLIGTRVTDAGLAELKGLKNLTELNLCNTQVSDAGLKELKELTNLTVLYLGATRVTDAGLAELQELKNLTVLGLGTTRVTDAGLAELKELKNLTELYLGGTQVTDAGLKELKELKNLAVLTLPETQVSDAGLKELAGMKLKYLSIPDAAKTDLGLKHYLEAIEPRTSLDLREWQVTDAGLAELKGLTNLNWLYLGGTRVTDAGLAELKELKNLTELYLGGTRVTDAGLAELKELKNLTELDLSETQVSDAGLAELKGLTNLTKLYLGNTQVSDAGLAELQELKNLTELGLGGTRVTDAGLKKLKELKNLTGLYLWDTQVSDEGLAELRELKNLTALSLQGTRMTDAGLAELKELKNLAVLSLSRTQVTDAGVEELRKSLPKCWISK